MKHQIKHRFDESVLFVCNLPDDTPAGLGTHHALEKATSARANLAGAYLARANLDGAYLARANLDGAYLAMANLDGAYLAMANLDGAYLDMANLTGANLTGANLTGAYLDGANLTGANLTGANLAGAYLDGILLVGERPIFQIGPIGSRCAYFTAYLTTEGVKLRAGCFFGTVEEFTEKLSKEHGDNTHAKEYRAALVLIEAHAEIWGKE